MTGPDEASEALAPTHRHLKTGGLYRVLHEGAIEANLTPCIIYQNVASGAIWVRPSSEFWDGRFADLRAQQGEGAPGICAAQTDLAAIYASCAR
jgi:hypothetical protein